MLINLKWTIFKIIIFGVVFAYVESAVVVYLRHLLSASYSEIGKGEILLILPGIAFLQPQTALEVIKNSSILSVEKVREAVTLVMLAVVSSMSSKDFKKIIAFFFLSFGIWDIFYYIFLRLIINWPTKFTDIDVFFLLPVPWVGPVFVPIIISLGMVFLSLIYLKKSV